MLAASTGFNPGTAHRPVKPQVPTRETKGAGQGAREHLEGAMVRQPSYEDLLAILRSRERAEGLRDLLGCKGTIYQHLGHPRKALFGFPLPRKKWVTLEKDEQPIL